MNQKQKRLLRILKTRRKVKQRERMMKSFGLQGGTMYSKHRAKITKSTGYMRDGNVSHYIQVGFNQKTNNRGNYGKSYNPSIRDIRQLDRGRELGLWE